MRKLIRIVSVFSTPIPALWGPLSGYIALYIVLDLRPSDRVGMHFYSTVGSLDRSPVYILNRHLIYTKVRIF